jgi:hypothetical protein
MEAEGVMERPTIKNQQNRRGEVLIDEVRFLLDAHELGETSQIPHYERAVMRAAVEMVCGPEVWVWIEERWRFNEENAESLTIVRVS